MNTSIMGPRGRITVPVEVRRWLAMGPGARLRWEVQGESVVVVKLAQPVAGERLAKHDGNYLAPGVDLPKLQETK